MARFKSNKKKLYIGFIGEREAAEYIATSNIGPFTFFFSCVEQIFQVYCNISLRFSPTSAPKVMHTMPTTNLSSLPPQKKFIKCSLGPFPLNFNLAQGKIGFCSIKRNRAPKKITKLFHLNPANIFCGHIFCHFLSKSVFLPVQSASMFFPQQYAAKNTETIKNMYSFDVTSKS